MLPMMLDAKNHKMQKFYKVSITFVLQLLLLHIAYSYIVLEERKIKSFDLFILNTVLGYVLKACYIRLSVVSDLHLQAVQ